MIILESWCRSWEEEVLSLASTPSSSHLHRYNRNVRILILLID
jgi:hypothetical protein